MKRLIIALFTTVLVIGFALSISAKDESMLVHVKTDLSEDDAQICVAYNVIWSALEKGYKVSVMIDASAVNTYKIGWRGKDKLEGYKLPESLRKELARQFGGDLSAIPKTYGKFLDLLHKKGAKFYINGAFMVLAGISEKFGDMSGLSTDIFKPVTISEMVDMVNNADKYIAY